MKLKISIIILISFIIIFSFLFVIDEKIRPKILDKDKISFFSQDFSDDKKIFVIGSSQIGRLNALNIENTIKKNNLNYQVFNLAYDGDIPSSRIENVQEIISLEPKVIIYGLSFRDFDQETVLGKLTPVEKILPHSEQIIEEILPTSIKKLEKINPKQLTYMILEKYFKKSKIDMKSEIDNSVKAYNTPFITYPKHFYEIKNEEEILKESNGKIIPIIHHIDPSSNNLEIKNLKRIIKDFQKNDIKLIIVITPIHKKYLDNIPNYEKENFKILLKNIEKEFDITIYDMTYKYIDLDVWQDFTHISLNPEIKIFDNDVSKIILRGIQS